MAVRADAACAGGRGPHDQRLLRRRRPRPADRLRNEAMARARGVHRAAVWGLCAAADHSPQGAREEDEERKAKVSHLLMDDEDERDAPDMVCSVVLPYTQQHLAYHVRSTSPCPQILSRNNLSFSLYSLFSLSPFEATSLFLSLSLETTSLSRNDLSLWKRPLYLSKSRPFSRPTIFRRFQVVAHDRHAGVNMYTPWDSASDSDVSAEANSCSAVGR